MFQCIIPMMNESDECTLKKFPIYVRYLHKIFAYLASSYLRRSNIDENSMDLKLQELKSDRIPSAAPRNFARARPVIRQFGAFAAFQGRISKQGPNLKLVSKTNISFLFDRRPFFSRFSLLLCCCSVHIHHFAAASKKTGHESGKKDGFLIKFGDWNAETIAFKYAFNVHKQ